MKLTLKAACLDDLVAIHNLVNLAYRGEQGWTTEAGFVAGNRVGTKEIQGYLDSSNAHLFIAKHNSELIACICIEQEESGVQIGLFAVQPSLQGQGVGKDILSQVEQYAATTLNIKKYTMYVLSGRDDLIDFYQRRGYIRTGKLHSFPTERNVGSPIDSSLKVEMLEKIIS